MWVAIVVGVQGIVIDLIRGFPFLDTLFVSVLWSLVYGGLASAISWAVVTVSRAIRQ